MFAWLRSLRRLLWWAFLIALPLNLPALLDGAIEGYFYAADQRQMYQESIRHYEHNVLMAESMDWYSVPGAPGIHDHGVTPFFIPQLRNPNDWWERVGLRRFDIITEETPINHYASLDVLYRRMRKTDEPWHHWIYFSNGLLLMDGLLNDWDQAFQDLLQHHSANPPASNAGFHYLQCQGHFLCDIWRTRGPALLHLTTEVPEEEDYVPERVAVPGYAPVTARLIEFPVTEDLPLAAGVFPTMFKQLQSITSNPYAWELFQPYNEIQQWALRLQDMTEVLEKKYPKTYGRLVKTEEYLFNKIVGRNGVLSDMMQLSRMSSMVVVMLGDRVVEVCVNLAKSGFKALIGTIYDSGSGDADLEPPFEENFMAQMLRDFLDHAGEQLGVNVEEQMKASPEGQEALGRMWDIVHGKAKLEEMDEENEESLI